MGLTLLSIGATLTSIKYTSQSGITLSPTAGSVLSTTTTKSSPKSVIAFLPFWLIDDVKDRPFPPITHLAYFGLDFDQNGNLKTKTEDGYTEPGLAHFLKEPFSQISRKAKDNGVKMLLVLRMMENEAIEKALLTQEVRNKVISLSVTTLSQRNFDGINIDFEYSGTPTQTTIQNLTEFTREIKSACQKRNPACEISIDIYADSARKIRIWDLKSLNSIVDQIIIMGYDFARPGSEFAGPVAPLRGSCTDTVINTVQEIRGFLNQNCTQDYDLVSSIRDTLSVVSRHKLILAVPFYGYEWPTATENPRSQTTDRGSTASYKRINALIVSLKLLKENYTLKMDQSSLTPFLVYKDRGQPTQIWFDNKESLRLKRQLVDNTDIGGIAAWAWGYDDETGDLWNEIANH